MKRRSSYDTVEERLYGGIKPYRPRRKEDAVDIWFAFFNKEISLAQLRARLKDIGWTDEEIEDGLDEPDEPC